MQTKQALQLSIIFIGTLLFSCGKDEGNNDNDLPTIEITNAQNLSANLTLDGAVRKSGDIPSPSATTGFGKNLQILTPEIVLSPDDYKMELSIESDGVAKIIYLQIDGVDEHFEITIDANGNTVFKNSNSANQGRNNPILCMCYPPGQCNEGLIGYPYVPEELVAPATVQVYEPPLQGTVPDLSHLLNMGYWSAKRPIVIRVKKEKPTGASPCDGVSCADPDGNVYPLVSIGNQCWMAENLNTTKYNDGVVIPNITDGTQWSSLTTGAWSHYENDDSYEDVYGKLYNWHAVSTGKLCPSGWHVPTDADWKKLTDHLGEFYVAGGKMKSTGTIYWESPNTDATNASGFTGLPGGERSDVAGIFGNLGKFGYWWSSTEIYSTSASMMRLVYTNGGAITGSQEKTFGLSCRCVKD